MRRPYQPEAPGRNDAAVVSLSPTLAGQLARAPSTILIDQDSWLSKLYPEEIQTIADYVKVVPRLCAVLGPHASELLRLGLSVVLDRPANTVVSRAWMRSVFEAAGAAHVLHVLDVADQVSLEWLRARNAAGLRPYKLDEAQFEELSRYYEPPTPDERFAVVVHSHG